MLNNPNMKVFFIEIKIYIFSIKFIFKAINQILGFSQSQNRCSSVSSSLSQNVHVLFWEIPILLREEFVGSIK